MTEVPSLESVAMPQERPSISTGSVSCSFKIFRFPPTKFLTEILLVFDS